MIAIDKASIERAVEKARRVKNYVRMISFRRYEVITPELNAYTVTFDVRNGRKVGSCNCKAGQFNTPCHHLASAIVLHLAVARIKAEAEKTSKPEPKPTQSQRRADEAKAILVKRPPAGERLNGFDI